MTFASFVILAWVPVAAGLFAALRPVRALVLAYLIGWMALPMAQISLSGFWDIDKILATNIGATVGVLLFCPKVLKGYKPSLGDAALLLFLAGTGVTSVVNGLGVYDGVATLTNKMFYLAIPFWLGRAFIKDQRDLVEACHVVVTGAALYAVLAVWEWRMSPQIHNTIYGVQHAWSTFHRWGFWRPIVCFPSCLALGIFFTWTALLGIWLYRLGKIRPLLGLPPALVMALPLFGLLASMSLGPWSLFAAGLALLWAWKRLRWTPIVLLPAIFAVIWMTGRITGTSDGRWFSSLTRQVSDERADSLQYRIDAETLLLNRAKQQVLLGWGGWGRNRVTNEEGENTMATDGLWIIFLGSFGLLGLVSFYLWWCFPLLLCVKRGVPGEWNTLVGVLVVIVGIEAVDFLFNAFLSPVLTLVSGGLVTVFATARQGFRAGEPSLGRPIHPPARRPSGQTSVDWSYGLR